MENLIMLIKINKKILPQKFLPLSEAEIWGLLPPAQVNLGYFLAWFQSLQMPLTPSERPLASKCHVYVLNCEWNFSFFIF
jgi:hypothetical protein